MSEQRKAVQEPMVWLMVGIPVLTVFAGLYTLYLAFNSGPLDLVPASVQHPGLAQVLDSAEDRMASERNYRGFLLIDDSNQPWSLSVKTVPETLLAGDTQVVFVHPNSASQDITIVVPANTASLTMSENLSFKPQQILLKDLKNTWRLVGTYEGNPTTMLTPALHSQ